MLSEKKNLKDSNNQMFSQRKPYITLISQENKIKTDVFLILSLKLASRIKKHSGSSQNTYFW